MVTYQEKVNQTRRKFRRKLNLDYDPAVLGDGQGNVAVRTRPGYVWVREQRADGTLSKPFPVLLQSNSSIKLDNGAGVKLGWDEQQRRIVKESDANQFLVAGVDTVDTSSASNQGSDRQSTPQATIETLRVIAHNPIDWAVSIKGIAVIINKIYYRMLGKDDVDLTSVQPDPGEKCYIGLFLENDYDTIRITSSTPRAIIDVELDDDDVQECIDASDVTDTPIWFIPVNGDLDGVSQTEIDNGIDGRQIVNSGDGGDITLDHTFIVQTGSPSLPNAQALDLLSYGVLTQSSGVISSTPPGTNRNVLISNGTLWESRALVVADIPLGIDHGGLVGLADDDHTQYIIYQPQTSVRNLIDLNVDVIGLTIQANGTQTADLFVVESSTGSDYIQVLADGKTHFHEHIAIGDTAPDPSVILFLAEEWTASANGISVYPALLPGSNTQTMRAIDIYQYLDAATATTGHVIAGQRIYLENYSTQSIASNLGLDITIDHLGSGSITAQFGNSFQVYNSGAGNIVNLGGMAFTVSNFSTGNVTNLYGINMVLQPNANVTNAYGINIGAVSGAVNNYNIRSQGSSSRNWFEGDVWIGPTLLGSGDLNVSSGTNAIPIVEIVRNDTAITASEVLGQIKWRTNDSNVITNIYGAMIEARASSTGFTSDAAPSILGFWTQTSAGVLTERLALTQNSLAIWESGLKHTPSVNSTSAMIFADFGGMNSIITLDAANRRVHIGPTVLGSGDLNVASVVNTTPVIEIIRNDTTVAAGDNNLGQIKWRTTDSSVVTQPYAAMIEVLASDGGYVSDRAQGMMLFYTTPNSGTGPALTERMRIDASGNVGIANSSPAEKLDVTGNVKVSGNITTGGIVKAPRAEITEVTGSKVSSDFIGPIPPNSNVPTMIVSAFPPLNPRPGDFWLDIA